MSRLSKGTLIIPHPWPLPELPGVQNPPTSQVIPATADDGSERTAQKDALGISRITPVSFPRVCIVQRALSSTVTLAHIVNTVRTNTRRKGAVVGVPRSYRSVAYNFFFWRRRSGLCLK
jgi:hypothetical protein